MPKLLQNQGEIEFSQMYYYYLFVIVFIALLVRGNDLWESCVNRPKCLSAYMIIAKCYICQEC